jgi:2-succinyl-5-enolpyruvyl-6-hydroxy-3-cyclohexene-1-carboxylate synthase
MNEPGLEMAESLVAELARLGLRDVCVAPGSRSTPLVLSFVEHPVEVHTHLDERSAGFFGLGLAQATGRPVALVCTSGSAGAHFLPAVMEAHASGVPLLVLTADRPTRLRDCASPQTTDQSALYANHVVWSETLENGSPRWVESRVDAAWERMLAHSAPVHLNVALDEPLVRARRDRVPEDRPPRAPVLLGERQLTDESLARLGRRLQGRGLVVAGPRLTSEDAEAVRVFASRWRCPIVADPLSGLRSGGDGSGVLTTADLILRGEAMSLPDPDWILRVGAPPTSKYLNQWLEQSPAFQWLLDPEVRRRDPGLSAALFVRSAVPDTLFRLCHQAQPADEVWLAEFEGLEARVTREVDGHVDDAPWWYEGSVFRDIWEVLPAGGELFVASSMPVRDLDTFVRWRRASVTIRANRGLNGIDGLTSTALGIASGSRRPTVAVLGDVGFLHDLGGLHAARLPREAGVVLVVLNNGGGGIFEYLPIASRPDVLASCFVMEHSTKLAGIAESFGVSYSMPQNREELREALRPPAAPEVRLVEVGVDRADSLSRHRALWGQVRRMESK